MQKDFFFTPFFVLHVERLTGLGLASVSHTLASKEDSEKIIQPTINLKKKKTEGQQRALIMRWLQWCSLLPRGLPFRSCSR